MRASSPPSTRGFVLRLLSAAVLRYPQRTAAALGLVVLAKLAVVAVPLALKAIIDNLGAAPVAVLPVFLLLGYALLRFLGTFFSEVRDVVFVLVTQKTVSGFLLDVFQHLHRLSSRFHARRRMGGVTRDVERGTAGIGFLLGVGLFTILPTMIEIIAVIVIMTLNYSDWFTGVILATFLVYTSFTVLFTERRAIYQRALNELDSSANGRLVDSLLNQETVKYYTNEHYEQRRFGTILDDWVDVGVKNQKALSMLHIGQSAIIAVGVAVVMLLAAQNVVQGTMSIGDLVLVNAYVIQICLPLNSLGFVFRQTRDAAVNAEKMLRLLEQKPEIGEAAQAADLAVSRGEVRFEHVDFGYEPNRQILWDVSFTISPGGTVAVVGGSGSGKSTLARLLFRFYEVGGGRILIDGVDIREVSLRSLRAALGIVPQDTILFNDTVAYNIAYGRPGVSLAEVIDAAKAAHVHDFISALPNQYDAEVGERGVMLSGGEKQRIAIARAILKNPPILVFDEATSALDTRSERAIQDELDRLAKTRTTLIIAHRLSTVVDADEILVLEHGRVVERGSHDHLLRQGGIYAQLWQLQRQQQEVERAERGLATQQINLVALLAGVVDGLRAAIDARGIGFYSTITADPVRITGDPGLLQQVMWALAENAIASTPPGGRAEWRIERVGERLRVSFIHAGKTADAEPPPAAGVPQLDLTRIRAIVEQHHGTIELRRDPDGDVRAVVEFPLRGTTAIGAAAAQGGAEPVAGTPALAAPSISGINVLVVDDNAEIRAQLEALLNRHGALSRSSPSGAAALQGLFALPRSRWPDILVCDVALGDEEDGYEVIRQLRRFEVEHGFGLAERLPAVALSAYRGDHRMRAMLAGFQVCIAKPVDADELVAVIANLAGRRTDVPAPPALEPPP
ncbi:ABC transporter transmembrane domain-containing protein [Aromatoleum aromaticum]|uniref:Probable ABC transport protein, ATP-binding protein n=1 Tax=Aromatoleum aromaticum (strain DSM 19018 / LMG 30748 / EbN1) TaxID=76114 RepID=Q5NY11_AROAE|nr:ABC transporter transmembrane domain-containing protein [Aromatoleum aromaticum]NMG55151.1 ATP-binding cassette domain-containing protein [Aromatoleum aromaticum]CAI10053.1 probable ABC transport protein, ATP-binding protein [Aromatoleum aromaticum EbN1]